MSPSYSSAEALANPFPPSQMASSPLTSRNVLSKLSGARLLIKKSSMALPTAQEMSTRFLRRRGWHQRRRSPRLSPLGLHRQPSPLLLPSLHHLKHHQLAHRIKASPASAFFQRRAPPLLRLSRHLCSPPPRHLLPHSPLQHPTPSQPLRQQQPLLISTPSPPRSSPLARHRHCCSRQHFNHPPSRSPTQQRLLHHHPSLSKL